MESHLFDLAKIKLSNAGLKVTLPRLIVYATLINATDHPTAEKILDKLKSKYPSISLATLYKNLDTLVATGLISKVKSSEGNYRYDPKTDNHSHIYCENTNEIIDFEDAELEKLLTEYFQKKNIYNLKINNISLQINAQKINQKEKILIQ